MSAYNHNLTDSPDEQLRMARRRARMKLGWYLHASVYILVNLGLTTLAALQGRHWAVYPAVFWGLGLAMHGATVWISSPHSALWARMVDKELRAMQSPNKK